MKNFFVGMLLLLKLLCVIIALYSIFAGVWGFNPLGIELFNAKLGITAFVSGIIFHILVEVIEDWF